MLSGSGLNLAQIAVSAGSGGGGDVPEWVPDNANIFVDLIATNNQAWEDGVGEGLPASYLGADPNSENAWGSTSYSAADLTEDGLVYSTTPPALIGAARSRLLGGSTFVMRFVQTNEEDDPREIDIVLSATNGNDAIEISIGSNTPDSNINVFSWGGSFDETITGVANGFEEGAVNVVAVTLDGFRCEFSLNGSDPIAGTLDSGDRPPGNPLTAVIIDTGGGNALQSITFYDTLPSTAGLSALSATGVVNTAPVSVTADWLHLGDAVPFTTETTVADDFISMHNIAIYVEEAQGNPSTLTITDDAGGRVSIVEGVQRNKIIAFDGTGGLDHVAEPTITFTLRVTDSGGLVTDQVFTIHVIATP